MKIVINGCYGGFSLSYEAMCLYLYAKGQNAYFYADVSTYDDYTKIHKYQRVTLGECNKLHKQYYIYCTTEDQGEILDHFPEHVFNFREIDRTDPVLVSVVSTMGSDSASGKYAQLYIEEVTDGTLYKIDTYDGLESIITQEDDDWLCAVNKTTSILQQCRIDDMWELIKPREAS